MGKPVWVRFVLVPGLTDDPGERREGRALRRADEERRVGRGAALPPDGRLQVEGARASTTRSPTRRRPTGAQVARGARDLPRRRLPGALKRTGRRRRMMASSATCSARQPILALFLAIGLGYAVGQINILGFSLGIGAVLFVGLVHRRHRAQGADRRADRPDRAGHVPLRDRHPLRPAVLRGADGPGPHLQRAAPWSRSSPGCWWRSGSARPSTSSSATRSASSPAR